MAVESEAPGPATNGTVVPAPLQSSDLTQLWSTAIVQYNDTVKEPELKLYPNARELTMDDVINNVDAESVKFQKYRHKDGSTIVKIRTWLGANSKIIQTIAEQVTKSAAVAFPPATTILTVITYSINVAQKMSADYDKLYGLFAEMGNFLKALTILEGSLPNSAPYRQCVTEVLSSFLVVIGISTRYMWKKRVVKMWNTIVHGEDDALVSAYSGIHTAFETLNRATGFMAVNRIEFVSGTVSRIEGKIDTYHAEDAAARGKTDKLIADLPDSFMAKLTSETLTKMTQDKIAQQKVTAKKKVMEFFTTKANPNTSKASGVTEGESNKSGSDINAQTKLRAIEKEHIKGTSEWLFDLDDYKHWSKKRNPYFFVQAAAGDGKSFLSYAVVQHVTAIQTTSLETSVAYFFFSEDQGYDSIKNALGNCVRQIADKNTKYCEAVFSELPANSSDTLSDFTIPVIWEKFFASRFTNDSEYFLYLILDGFDRTDQIEREQMIKALQQIRDDRLHIQIFLTGRAVVSHELDTYLVPLRYHLKPDVPGLADDIQIMTKYRFKSDPKLKAFRQSTKDKILEKLPMDKGPTYAARMLQQLSSGSERAAERTLERPPEGLNDMYKDLVAKCRRGTDRKGRDPEELPSLKLFYRWMTYCEGVLLVKTVEALMKWKDDWFDVKSELKSGSASILEVVDEDDASGLEEINDDEDSPDEDHDEGDAKEGAKDTPPSEEPRRTSIVRRTTDREFATGSPALLRRTTTDRDLTPGLEREDTPTIDGDGDKPYGDDATVEFQTDTLKAYFIDPTSDLSELGTRAVDAHVELFKDCVEVMLNGTLDESKRDESKSQLENYCCYAWIKHLRHLQPKEASKEHVGIVLNCLGQIAANAASVSEVMERHDAESYQDLAVSSDDLPNASELLSQWAQCPSHLGNETLSATAATFVEKTTADPIFLIRELARGHVKRWYQAPDRQDVCRASYDFAKDALAVTWATAPEWNSVAETQAIINAFPSIPLNAKSHYAIAMVYYQNGEYHKCLEESEAILSANPDPWTNFRAWSQMAACYYQSDVWDFAKGIEVAKEAIEAHKAISTDSIADSEQVWTMECSTWHTKAVCEFNIEEYAEALESWITARRKIQNDNPGASYLWAALDCYVRLERWAEAVKLVTDLPVDQAALLLTDDEEQRDVTNEAFIKAVAHVAEPSDVVPLYESIAEHLKPNNTYPLQRGALVSRWMRKDFAKAKELGYAALDGHEPGQETVHMEHRREIGEMTFEQYRVADTLEEKDLLVAEIKHLPNRGAKSEFLVIEEAYLAVLQARMYKKMGPAKEYYTTLDETFKLCIAKLTDNISSNDSPSLRLMAKVLATFGGEMKRDAEIALSLQFSKIADYKEEDGDNPEAAEKAADESEGESKDESKNGTIGKIATTAKEPEAGNTPIATPTPTTAEGETTKPVNGGITPASENTSEKAEGNETDQRKAEEEKDEAEPEEEDPDTLTHPTLPEYDGDLEADAGIWCNGECIHNATGRELITHYPHPVDTSAEIGQKITTRDGLYLCIMCLDCDLCEPCHKLRLQYSSGEKEMDFWKPYCGVGHEYVRGPVEGWRGVQNGVIRIAKEVRKGGSGEGEGEGKEKLGVVNGVNGEKAKVGDVGKAELGGKAEEETEELDEIKFTDWLKEVEGRWEKAWENYWRG